MEPAGLRLGNGLTLEELSEIEEQAHRSGTDEAATILRVAAALREALQIRNIALSLITAGRDSRTSVASTQQLEERKQS